MTPFWHDDHLTLYGGDCRAVLAELPAESVHCVVTSSPYWGLRDYGLDERGLGLEATPEEFVANMVAVFREVRRVLRADGTLWLNLGDSYTSAGGGGEARMAELHGERDTDFRRGVLTEGRSGKRPFAAAGLKQKDLVGIPWRVAFALQADGWYLRSDIIWAKPNPMPESVTDRPTKAHEYLFLLTKSPRYYYDADAVREDARYGYSPTPMMFDGVGDAVSSPERKFGSVDQGNGGSRNLRTVWTIATEPYPGAHFATFPRKLVEPCVKAGTSERGVCPECGAPWVRESVASYDAQGRTTNGPRSTARRHESPGRDVRMVKSVETTGWRSSCIHDAEPVPAVVLDPFAGSGTTLLVAQALGRRGVGIDLNPEYLEQALARNRQTPLGLVG